MSLDCFAYSFIETVEVFAASYEYAGLDSDSNNNASVIAVVNSIAGLNHRAVAWNASKWRLDSMLEARFTVLVLLDKEHLFAILLATLELHVVFAWG